MKKQKIEKFIPWLIAFVVIFSLIIVSTYNFFFQTAQFEGELNLQEGIIKVSAESDEPRVVVRMFYAFLLTSIILGISYIVSGIIKYKIKHKK